MNYLTFEQFEYLWENESYIEYVVDNTENYYNYDDMEDMYDEITTLTIGNVKIEHNDSKTSITISKLGEVVIYEDVFTLNQNDVLKEIYENLNESNVFKAFMLKIYYYFYFLF